MADRGIWSAARAWMSSPRPVASAGSTSRYARVAVAERKDGSRTGFDRCDDDDDGSTIGASPQRLRADSIGRVWLLVLYTIAVVGVAAWIGRWSARPPFGTTNWPPPRNAIVFSNGTVYARPPSLKVVGLVFFGRRQYVDVLDCYLRRNLVVNGGLLEEVRFVMHTRTAEDKAWLESLVESAGLQDYYELLYEDTASPEWQKEYAGFRRIFSTMTDPDTIFVKIDDDILFMEDHAVGELVRAVIEHTEAYAIVANIVNNAFTRWYHHRGNAIYPYLPELTAPLASDQKTWHPSALPDYTDALPEDSGVFDHILDNVYPSPYANHRWLPLRSLSRAEALSHTPYNNTLPSADHDDFIRENWPLAAQSHYSFFEHAERGTLEQYHFGTRADGIQNLWYTRYSINVFAIRGSNVALMPFWNETLVPEAVGESDEIMATVIAPRLLRMPVLLATRALANHHSYGYTQAALADTDILDRYRMYANDVACAADNQKTAFAGS